MGCYEEAQERRATYARRGERLNYMIHNSPHAHKIDESLEVIKEALKFEKPVIASSFGKDSVALIHLVHQIDNTVPIVFTNTGVNFRETIEYMETLKEKWNLTIYELHPEMTFWEIVERYGYPKESRNSKTGDKREPKCCKILKYAPMKKFIKEYRPGVIFTGLRGDEGRQRRWPYILHGHALYEDKTNRTMKCIPLIWWTSKDIWEYHDMHGIPRNPAYEKYGIDRTGCIPCTGHKNWQAQLRRISPRLYVKVATDMGRPPLEYFEEVGP